jgi:hypothetical protein
LSNPTKTFDVYLTPGVYQFKNNMSASNITIEDENGSNTDYCQGLSRAAISFQDNNISYNYIIYENL